MAILVTRGAGYIGGVTVVSGGENTWLFGQSGGGHRQALDYGTPDGTAIRAYIHVSDLADAPGRALEYLREDRCSEFLSPGSSCGCSVLEVIKSARQVTE